jgi:hypothetical protein
MLAVSGGYVMMACTCWRVTYLSSMGAVTRHRDVLEASGGSQRYTSAALSCLTVCSALLCGQLTVWRCLEFDEPNQCCREERLSLVGCLGHTLESERFLWMLVPAMLFDIQGMHAVQSVVAILEAAVWRYRMQCRTCLHVHTIGACTVDGQRRSFGQRRSYGTGSTYVRCWRSLDGLCVVLVCVCFLSCLLSVTFVFARVTPSRSLDVAGRTSALHVHVPQCCVQMCVCQ